MTARVLRPAITFTTVAAVLVAALAVYAFLSAGAARADSLYSPTTNVRLCNALPAAFVAPPPGLGVGGGPACAEDLTAGAATDYSTITDWPATGLNFCCVATMSPNAPTVVAGNPLVGGLRSATLLGTLNNPCTTALEVDFILYNVSLPKDLIGNPTSVRAAMVNIAWPQPEGTSDRHSIWKVGDGVHTSSPPLPTDPDFAAPTDTPITGDSFTADGTTLAIANYPHHLLDMFDPDFVSGVSDGPAQPKIPLAAYGGLTKVAGTWIPLYFLVFPAAGANSLSGGTPMPYPLGDINSSMGFPSVTILTDPTAAFATPSTISDFCSALNVTTMMRSTVHTNPAAGTQMFVQYNGSQRDTDQDGYENQIDTCPYNAAPAENPRNALGVNDTDADGIMNSCDLNNASAGDPDVDGDGFQNRQDNCPQVANPSGTDSDTAAVTGAADKGPRSDGLGNACDSGSITITQNGRPVTIALSDAVANGRYMSRSNVVAKCFDSGPEIDADGDGYCTAGGVTTDNADSGVCTGTVPNSCAVRHGLWLGAANPALQQDTDGDNVVPPVGNISFFTDAVETYLTTDPTKPCAQTRSPAVGAANDEGPLDNWPLDMNDDGVITNGDSLKYNFVLAVAVGGNRAVNMGGDGNGTATAPATISTVPLMGVQSQTRFDLNLDGFLSPADQGKFNPYMNKACGVAGTPPTTLGGAFQQ